MKRAILLALLLPLPAWCEIPAGYAERMADAIYRAEGGSHTRHPYGVLSVNVPLRTVTTRERFGFALSEAVAPPMTVAQLVGARRVAKFLREYGVEFEGEFATVGGFVIVDIGLRMLTARELFRAQGFPDKYVIDRAWVVNPKTGAVDEIRLTKEQQIRMCGNSVSPPVAAALVAANSGDMAVWGAKERKKTMRRSYASV